MKRWCSTNASASGPANSCSPHRKTRSQGTNTSSKTVVVSIILWRGADRVLDGGSLRGRRIVGRGQQHQARACRPGRRSSRRSRGPPSAIARVGSTISSFALVLTEVCAFAPRTTMPSAPPLDDVHVEVGVGLCRRRRAIDRP